MQVRELQPGEWGVWLRLRERLWSDTAARGISARAEEIAADPARNAVFVAVHAGTGIVGFVEVSLREWAEGCGTHPVGYIEAWYVEPHHRRNGNGRRLIEAARGVGAAGCTEMGSDAELGNEVKPARAPRVGLRRGHTACPVQQENRGLSHRRTRRCSRPGPPRRFLV